MTRTEKLVDSQEYAINTLQEKLSNTESRIRRAEIEAHIEQLRSVLVSLVNFNAKQEKST